MYEGLCQIKKQVLGQYAKRGQFCNAKPLHQQKSQKGKVTTQTTPQKSSIKQQLRTDLGRSVGVTTATQMVWFTRFTGPNLPTHRNSRLIEDKNMQIVHYSDIKVANIQHLKY